MALRRRCARSSARHNITGLKDLEVANADEVIGMDEHPAEAVRAKRRNSMTVALELVRGWAGAGAAVTAGNSGAMLAGVTLYVAAESRGSSGRRWVRCFPSANGAPLSGGGCRREHRLEAGPIWCSLH